MATPPAGQVLSSNRWQRSHTPMPAKLSALAEKVRPAVSLFVCLRCIRKTGVQALLNDGRYKEKSRRLPCSRSSSCRPSPVLCHRPSSAGFRSVASWAKPLTFLPQLPPQRFAGLRHTCCDDQVVARKNAVRNYRGCSFEFYKEKPRFRFSISIRQLKTSIRSSLFLQIGPRSEPLF